MKLLFISSFYLHPKTQVGGSRRLWHLVEALAQSAEVDLFCLDACREAPEGEAERSGAQAGVLHVTGAKASGLRDFDFAPVRDGDTGWSRLWTPPNRIRQGLQKYRPRFERFLRRDYDAVLLAFPWALDAFDAYWPKGRSGANAQGVKPPAPFFYLEDDLVLEWYAKVGGPISLLRRCWKHYQVVRMAADYRRKLAKAKGFIAISKEEAEVARLHFQGLAQFILPHALPMQQVPFLDKSPVPQAIGFLANFDHTPNRVALDFLLRDLWPVLRKADEGITLVLAGKGLPSQGKSAEILGTDADRIGCKWLGAVAEVADFYREIGVLVNPVTTGRGLRTKVIEAVAYGCPVVSTKLGREGIDDLDITEAETAEAFVTESLRLLKANDYELRRRRNRERAEQFYGVDAITQGLLAWMRSRMHEVSGERG